MRRRCLVEGAGRSGRLGLVALTCSLLAGCASLPTNGPTGSDIRRDIRGKDNVLGTQIVDVDAKSISDLAVPSDGGASLASLRAEGPVDTLGPGDVISVEIYEVGQGLFSSSRTNLAAPEAMPSAGGNALGSGLTVDREGAIYVPYVGRLEVAGLTTEQVQDKIVAGLSRKSQSPQVIVSLTKSVSSTVVLMGAVAKPGRVSLDLAGEHLLDVIAQSGGIALIANTGASTATGTGPQDMVVRFTRGQRTLEEPLDQIQSGSPDDLLLLPGDRIEIIRRPRTFTVFGALDRIAQMPFESQRLVLSEALARAGGPSDGRADPRSIFVFRLLGEQDGTVMGDKARSYTPHAVIYRLDMMHASGFIFAQQFAMRDKDLIYISNATSNRPVKLVSILNLLFTPVFSAKAVAN